MNKQRLIETINLLSLSDRMELQETIERMNLLDKQKLFTDMIWANEIIIFDGVNSFEGPDMINITINGKSLQVNINTISIEGAN